MYPYFYLLHNYVLFMYFFSNWTFFVQRHTIANVLVISVAHLVSGTQSSIDSIFHVCFSTFFFCFVSWKAICFTYCSLAKPLQFTNLLLHKLNRILWVKPYSTLEVFNSCPQWQLWSIWTLKRLMISQLNTKKRDGLRACVLFVPDFSKFRPGGTALKLLGPVTSSFKAINVIKKAEIFTIKVHRF